MQFGREEHTIGAVLHANYPLVDKGYGYKCPKIQNFRCLAILPVLQSLIEPYEF